MIAYYMSMYASAYFICIYRPNFRPRVPPILKPGTDLNDNVRRTRYGVGPHLVRGVVPNPRVASGWVVRKFEQDAPEFGVAHPAGLGA
jgi:hypothetical protein